MTKFTPAARWRAALLTSATALVVLAIGAAGAHAKVVRLAGTTTITPSSQATQFLADNGVTVSTTGPATAANGTVTLPIVAGFARPKTFTGILVHAGGLRFAKDGRSVVVRQLVVVRTQRRALVLARLPGRPGGCAIARRALRRFALAHPVLVQRHPGAARRVARAVRRSCRLGRVIVVARIANAAKQVSGASATLTADLRISRRAAGLVNRALGTQVQPGAPLGAARSSVTVVG